MNDKIKKFYYSTHKSVDNKYIQFLFKNLIVLIENCKVNVYVYVIFLIFSSLQSLFLVLEVSYHKDTHSGLKAVTRYFHLNNYWNNCSILVFRTFTYWNIIVTVVIIVSFIILAISKFVKLKNVISIILAYYYFIEKYMLLPYHITICLSVFKRKEDNIEIIFLMLINSLTLLAKGFEIYVISFLFNDWSVFSKRLLWSSPYNYITMTQIWFNIYLIMCGLFFSFAYILNVIIICSICLFIIYSRIQSPFYFHIEINYITIANEGIVIFFSIMYTCVSYFLEVKSSNEDIIYLLLASISWGWCYWFVITKIDSDYVLNFHSKLRKSWAGYEFYIFLLRISLVINRSQTEQKSSNWMFSFYTQHRVNCTDIECHCRQIDEWLNNKTLILRCDEEEGSLITEKEVLEETNWEENFFSKMNKKKSVKYLKLWGWWIESIIKKMDFIQSSFSRIEFSNFWSFYLKKYINSLIVISYINKNELKLPFQFYWHYSKLELINHTKELFETEIDENFFKVLEYNRYYEKFLKKIRNTSASSQHFWKELQKNFFNPEIIKTNGNLIIKNSVKLDKYSKSIWNTNSNDIRTLKIYGTFLCHVLKLPQESAEFLNKAFVQLVTNIDELNNQLNHITSKFTFWDEIESAVIIANGNKENIGRIEYVNYSFVNIFGFTKDEIVGKNLSIIMPRNIGKNHNQFMLNFYNTSKPRFLNQLRREIGWNKERLIHPIRIVVKMFPCIEEGIAYVGWIKKITFSNITKGPKHIRTNWGYWMTTEDGKLLHYNKIIEDILGWIPSLMYDDTKDKSEIFKVEMIFPELTLTDTKAEVNIEETRLFFTTRIIQTMKRMEYSKVYNELESTLNDYLNKKASSTTIPAQQLWSRKNKRNTKGLISIAENQNISSGNKEYLSKNTAIVSVTDFSYIMNIKFRIFQIVFERGWEQSMNNIIKRYQAKFEENKKNNGNNKGFKSTSNTNINTKSNNNITKNQTTIEDDVFNIESLTEMNKKIALVNNKYLNIRNNTFDKKSPFLIKLLNSIFISISFLLFSFGLVLLGFLVDSSKHAENTITLSNTLLKSLFCLEFIKESLIFYACVQIGGVTNKITFNNTYTDELLFTKINKLLSEIVRINNLTSLESKYDNEISNAISNSDIPLRTYFDEKSFTTTNQSLTSSTIILINSFNTVFNVWNTDASEITYKQIIANADFSYDLPTDATDSQKTMVKFILSLKYNFDLLMRVRIEDIVKFALQKSENKFEDYQRWSNIILIFNIIFLLCFAVLYSVWYVWLTIKNIKIWMIFTEIAPDTLENCLKEVELYNTNIENIIQNDIFFLNHYFNDGFDDNTLNSTNYNNKIYTTNSTSIHNNEDLNLGYAEWEHNNDIKQVFNKCKQKELISIKEYIEEKKEEQGNHGFFFNNTISLANNATHNSSMAYYAGGTTNRKVSSASNSRALLAFNQTLNNNNGNNATNNKDNNELWNSSVSVSNHNNESLENNKLSLSKPRLSISGSNNNWFYLPVNNMHYSPPIPQITQNRYSNDKAIIINKYKKRMIHKKSQINKIQKYKVNICFDKSILFMSLILFTTVISLHIYHYYKVLSLRNMYGWFEDAFNAKYYLNNLFPLIASSLITGEITTDSFPIIITSFYDSIKELLISTPLFLTKHQREYSKIYDLYALSKDGEYVCNITSQQYSNEISVENIYKYCMRKFYRNGSEFATNELIVSALNHFNYWLSFKDLESVERRMMLLLSNTTFLDNIQYNMFVVDTYLTYYNDVFANHLIDNIIWIEMFSLLNILLYLVVISVLLIVYFMYVRKRYLTGYVFNKGMVLMIPRREMLTDDSYRLINDI